MLVTGDAVPGALVTQELNTLEVEADALNIPEHVEVSVDGVQPGRRSRLVPCRCRRAPT